jgi:transcriptional regulator with GAF, ATPase, and Fis domain
VTAHVSRAELEDRLRDIQAITDAALSRLDDHAPLAELLDRTRAILRTDTAAVLLLDFSAGELIATAAAGLEEEVRHGVRIPVGRGFAGRIAAEHQPVVLDHVDHTTVLNPILWSKGIRTLMGVPLIASGKVIGAVAGVQRQVATIDISPDTLVCFYTDGLIERRGESLDVGLERLADAVASGPAKPDALCEQVVEQMRPAAGQLHDDVTALFARLV